MHVLLPLLLACAGPPDTVDSNPSADTGEDDTDTGPFDPGIIDWVELEGATFLMGSVEPEGQPAEWPAREVSVPTFAMGRTEVTAEQYRQCVTEGACEPLPEGAHCYWNDPAFADRAVTCVNYVQATAVCVWAGGRLPTEAEWEFAARSRGQDVEYPWGDAPEPSCDVAVMDNDDGVGCGLGAATVPCSRPEGSTEQGLCDMAGNVFEWNADWYEDGYADHPTDGSAHDGGFREYRVMRGGAVGSGQSLRTRERTYHPESFAYGGMGVRCAQDR